MNRKLIFTSTDPAFDFNRPSETIAYASKLVEADLARAVQVFHKLPKKINEKKHNKSAKILEAA